VNDPARDVLDEEALLERLGGDPGVLREVVSLFASECSRLVGEIRRALERGDAPDLARAAHSLKGTLATLSATQAQNAALRLEILGRGGELADAAGAFAELEETVERLRPALAELGQKQALSAC
jgi:HPt (histidine-containing phosphotransfer) domain-containing protein